MQIQSKKLKSLYYEVFFKNLVSRENLALIIYVFQHYRTLKFHIMRMHQKDKPFKCKECDNSYINKSELDMHFKYRHSKDVDIKLVSQELLHLTSLLKTKSLLILLKQRYVYPRTALSLVYHTRTIITRGLYTFYPLFEVHFCTVTFGLMYTQYSRAVSNQE